MAPGNASSVMISKAAEADWSYPGAEDWYKKPMNNVDFGRYAFLAEGKTNLLSSSWTGSHESSPFDYASNGLMSSAQFSTSNAKNSDLGDADERLSSLLQNKLSLSATDHLINSDSGSVKKKPVEYSDLEWQTIGSLLPSDDELFSSVAPDMDFGCANNSSSVGENEELDLFSSGGGLELEGDASEDLSKELRKNAESLSGNGTPSGVGEHPFGEHPSRTLFVRNINSNVEDSELRALFEQYGDIRTLYTACKHRGFVMISYYDIRAARSAMRALQNKSLRRRKLDIHFSIPKDNPSDKDVNQGTLVVFNLDASITNDDLLQIFGVYGEVKEIRETPHKRHHKFIEFYDVRSAEAALRALNRCDIAGKRIKLEPSRPGGTRRSLMQHLTNDLENDESFILRENSSSPITKSAPGQLDMMDSFFPEKVSAAEACHSLRMPPSFYLRTNTVPEPVQFSPQAVSALKARMISEHLLRMNASSFNNMSLLESANAGLVSGSSLPMHGMLSGSLNSLYKKEDILPLMSHTPSPQSYGVNGFVTRSPFAELGSHGHLLPGSVPAPHHHHVGSAPMSAFPLLDRQRAYLRDHFEASALSFGGGSIGVPVGSLGVASGFGRRNNMECNFTGSPNGGIPHTMLNNGASENAAHRNAWLMAQQQSKENTFSKSAHDMMPPPSEWSNERGRGRKMENSISQQDRKQYELDIDRIVRGEDTRTTLMIKNIPNKYTSKMLLAAIDENHKGTYDFVYLPIDFKNKCNVGYAFINMTEPSKIIPFYQAFNGKKWEKFNSEKVASLAYARIQGKAALIAHFQNSSLMNEDKRCRPILFHSEGPNVGDQEPFPVGPNPRTRMNKTRTNTGTHQGSPIINSSKEKIFCGV